VMFRGFAREVSSEVVVEKILFVCLGFDGSWYARKTVVSSRSAGMVAHNVLL
jgi:hypothetical protein